MLEQYSMSDVFFFNKLVSAAGRMARNEKTRLDSTQTPESKLAKFKNS